MNFQERIEHRRSQGNLAVVSNGEEDKAFDAEYYGIDSMRNAIYALVFYLSEGKKRGIRYTDIEDYIFHSPEEIELITNKKQVKIFGRDLERLFDYITGHRVRYIREHIGTDIEEAGLFVKGIEVNELL